MGFNLEICTLVVRGSKDNLEVKKSSTLDELFNVEVKVVEEKAAQDREASLGELRKSRQSEKATSTEFELAAHLHERLEIPTPMTTLDGSLYDAAHKSVEQKEKLGTSSTSMVFKATWLGVEVAKKTFYEPCFLDCMKETSIFMGLSHRVPNVTPFLDFAKDKRECSIVMKLMDEDLHSLIQRRMKTRKSLWHNRSG